MKNKDIIVVKEQTFGINTYENTCFCQLKTVYNSFFTACNESPCIGSPHMKCLIISLEGTGEVIYRDRTKTELPPRSVFFGSMQKMDLIKSSVQKWHFVCYWYIIQNYDQEFDGVYCSADIDFDKELADAINHIRLLQSRSFLNVSRACSMFTQKLFKFIDIFNFDSSNNHTMLDKMVLYINAHIKEKLTTGDIASEFGYCEKHVRYLFNKYFNVNPRSFIDGLKLEQITNLLQNSSYTLEELAEMYSYSSSSHLIYNFKKKYGFSPKQYLKRLKIRQDNAKL